ncbi:MAG: DNA gyrase/topoisomerase IV subunit A, partial [Bacteroidetes bacterium]|nr:DNA gyrase/topoisomerase IV subunit A [Bacteroidota bacterium]
ETIVASKVAVANVKLYINRQDGFAGFGLRRDELVCDCSDIDNIIVIRKDGVMTVTKITDKAFLGKGIMHINVWKKGDDRTIYNLVYQDGPRGNVMMKRFSVTSVMRDKEYHLTKGKEGSRILYLTANPNGETELVRVVLRSKPKLKKLKFDVDFAELGIKGRGAGGNILTKHSVSKIYLKEQGASSLGARKIWFDDTVQRLNAEERGGFLGEFSGDDKILTVMQSGHFQLSSFDMSNHFDEDMIIIEKWIPKKPLSIVYFDGKKQQHFVKRFLIEGGDRKTSFITEHPDSVLELVTTDLKRKVKIAFSKVKGKEYDNEIIELEAFIGIKGYKALGNRLASRKVKSVDFVQLAEEEKQDEAELISKLIDEETKVAAHSDDVEENEVQEDDATDEKPAETTENTRVEKKVKQKDNDEDQIKMDFSSN